MRKFECLLFVLKRSYICYYLQTKVKEYPKDKFLQFENFLLSSSTFIILLVAIEKKIIRSHR